MYNNELTLLGNTHTNQLFGKEIPEIIQISYLTPKSIAKPIPKFLTSFIVLTGSMSHIYVRGLGYDPSNIDVFASEFLRL